MLTSLFEVVSNFEEKAVLGRLLLDGEVDQLGRVLLRTVLLCFSELPLEQYLIAEVTFDVRLGFPRYGLLANCLLYRFKVH